MSRRRIGRDGPWNVRAGTVTGTAHLRRGGDGEDAYVVEQSADWLLVAVADGCSAARFAALGSALAAPLAVRLAEELLRSRRFPETGPQWRAFLATLRDAVIARFNAAAGELVATLGGDGPADLATTLITAVVVAPWVAVLAVGDGSVVVRSADEQLDLLVAPQDSRAVNTYGDTAITAFITTPDAAERAQLLVARIPDVDAIAVCTDGMDEVSIEFAGSEALRPAAKFYRSLFRWAADRDTEEVDLLRLLVEEQIVTRTEDDRTLVMAVRS